MKKNQKGFSIVELLLVVVVLGLAVAVGWLFVDKQSSKDSGNHSVGSSTVKESEKTQKPTPSEEPKDPYANWKTYTTSRYGVSIKYPKNWKVDKGHSSDAGDGRYIVSTLIRNASGKEVAQLNLLPQVGGFAPLREYKIVHAEKLALPTKEPSLLVFIAHGNKAKNSTAYRVVYGVTGEDYSTGKTGQQRIFYTITTPKNEEVPSIWFQGGYGGKDFSSVDDVTAFYESREGQNIRKMLASLTISD